MKILLQSCLFGTLNFAREIFVHELRSDRVQIEIAHLAHISALHETNDHGRIEVRRHR